MYAFIYLSQMWHISDEIFTPLDVARFAYKGEGIVFRIQFTSIVMNLVLHVEDSGRLSEATVVPNHIRKISPKVTQRFPSYISLACSF